MRAPFVVPGRLQAIAARRFPWLLVHFSSSSPPSLLEELMQSGVDLIHYHSEATVSKQQHQQSADEQKEHFTLCRETVFRYNDDPASFFASSDLPLHLHAQQQQRGGNSAVVGAAAAFSNTAGGVYVKHHTVKLENLRMQLTGVPIAFELNASLARSSGKGDDDDESGSIRSQTVEAAKSCDLLLLHADGFTLDAELQAVIKDLQKVSDNKPLMLLSERGFSQVQLQSAMRHSCAGVGLPAEALLGRKASPADLVREMKRVMTEASAKRAHDPNKNQVLKTLPDKWKKLLSSKGTMQSNSSSSQRATGAGAAGRNESALTPAEKQQVAAAAAASEKMRHTAVGPRYTSESTSKRALGLNHFPL